MKVEQYAAYFEAVKKILEGEPVENLDEIRVRCNNAVLDNLPDKVKKALDEKPVYSPELIILSFAADAENRILMGEYPGDVYGFVDKPEEVRESCRGCLANAVKAYL